MQGFSDNHRMNPESISAAFLVGLLGGTHCIGMCGGIVGALSSGLSLDVQVSRRRLFTAQLAYNTGRISSYTLAGVLLGLFGQQLGEWGSPGGFPVGRIVAGVIMILFGIYLAGWWHSLLFLEKAGAYLWKCIEPLGRRYIPVHGAGQAYLLGLVWGWLPCGMVYAVLALALASGSALDGGRDHAGIRTGYPARNDHHGSGIQYPWAAGAQPLGKAGCRHPGHFYGGCHAACESGRTRGIMPTPNSPTQAPFQADSALKRGVQDNIRNTIYSVSLLY